MSRYKVSNLSGETSMKMQSNLEIALKRVQGIREVRISAGRSEFSIDYTGMEPNINVIKEACTGAGFEIDRKLV